MKNSILIILILIVIFVLNIIFYYSFDSYSNFIKSLKDPNHKLENIEIEKKDDFLLLKNIVEQDNKENTIKKEIEEKNIKEIKKTEIEKLEKKELQEKKIYPEIKLGKNYQDIISKFSSYNLKLLDIQTNLFDLTNEYPDKYFEYYSRNLTLYLFPTKNYEEVLDIFEILELELPFKINEVGNLGDKSFYINLNSDLDDSIIRVIISHKGIVFGLKIKKSEYNSVKDILRKF